HERGFPGSGIFTLLTVKLLPPALTVIRSPKLERKLPRTEAIVCCSAVRSSARNAHADSHSRCVPGCWANPCHISFWRPVSKPSQDRPPPPSPPRNPTSPPSSPFTFGPGLVFSCAGV